MTKVPSLSYVMVVKALQRDGWTVVRQKKSHPIQKEFGNELLKITVPAQTINALPCSYSKTSFINLEHLIKLI